MKPAATTSGNRSNAGDFLALTINSNRARWTIDCRKKAGTFGLAVAKPPDLLLDDENSTLQDCPRWAYCLAKWYSNIDFGATYLVAFTPVPLGNGELRL